MKKFSTNRISKLFPIRFVILFLRRFCRFLHEIRTRSAPGYSGPSERQLVEIENRLREIGIPCQDFVVDLKDFDLFSQQIGFPPEYHGGKDSGVYSEKLLEHYIAWKFLSLGQSSGSVYLDVAACGSPWAKILRGKGIEAFAVDLSVPKEFSNLAFYQNEDATSTSFSNSSIGGASLQCAYEMFLGNKDIELILELKRILKPGGRVVVSPLYMHTHPCYYQTAEFYGSPFGDKDAKRYIRRSCWGVPSSRKYSPETLKNRVWDVALGCGMKPSLLVIRNKREIGRGVYLHFFLVIDRV